MGYCRGDRMIPDQVAESVLLIVLSAAVVGVLLGVLIVVQRANTIIKKVDALMKKLIDLE